MYYKYYIYQVCKFVNLYFNYARKMDMFDFSWKLLNFIRFNLITFTFSKSTNETLEKGVNMFKAKNKNTRATSRTSFWCLYSKLETYFTHFSIVSTVNLEQVNACCDIFFLMKIMVK